MTFFPIWLVIKQETCKLLLSNALHQINGRYHFCHQASLKFFIQVLNAWTWQFVSMGFMVDNNKKFRYITGKLIILIIGFATNMACPGKQPLYWEWVNSYYLVITRVFINAKNCIVNSNLQDWAIVITQGLLASVPKTVYYYTSLQDKASVFKYDHSLDHFCWFWNFISIDPGIHFSDSTILSRNCSVSGPYF